MYIFEDEYLEVVFRIRNFMHLTGAASNIGRKIFYRKAQKKDYGWRFRHGNVQELKVKTI